MGEGFLSIIMVFGGVNISLHLWFRFCLVFVLYSTGLMDGDYFVSYEEEDS